MAHSKDEKDWIVVDRVADIILSSVRGCVVDIGIGTSTRVLGRHAARFKRRHYTCDASAKIIKWFGPELHDGHTIFCGTSKEFMKQFDDLPALVLLDGWHSFDLVLHEATFFLECMSPGGVLFMHDTYPPGEKYICANGNRCGEAYRVRQLLENDENLWCFTWPYTNQAQKCGLTMVMKKAPERPFYQR